MRLHVVPLPHTLTSNAFNSCAYTKKVYNFIKMMSSIGYEVFHYGAEGSEVAQFCTHVDVQSKEEHLKWFGEPNHSTYYQLDWNGVEEYWKIINDRTAEEINRRKQPGDFICVIAGRLHKPIQDMAGEGCFTVEFGIGYDGTFAPYKVYESYAHMHKLAGVYKGFDPDGLNYEVVIPNYIDPDDFTFCDEPEDYYLFMGRLIFRKGIQVAVEATRRIGARLLIAGQGCAGVEGNKIYGSDGHVYEGDHLLYVGQANIEKRKYLMSHAKAVFVPTIYLGPFETVNAESQMCGTPVITTDFGVFTETVQHGKTGYRCRTLDHFVWAAQNVHKLDRKYIHERAMANWSIHKVKYMYDEYFKMLRDLNGKGWYEEHPERTQLDWLNKE